ncbi:hypothetical protein [Sphingomonas sp. ERG5]|uniref:hypothetical protein n=1 Tax=Sphingomonas sp. ERG5 TaxID=1381597 RepID=UPI0013649D54|nr:hypothetical protein [Sphingomonas sp. ERG5]
MEERDIVEAKDRGVIDGIIVEIDGETYSVSAYTAERIKLEIDIMARENDQFIIDPGSIVIKGEITIENVNKSIEKLVKTGYFKFLKAESK